MRFTALDVGTQTRRATRAMATKLPSFPRQMPEGLSSADLASLREGSTGKSCCPVKAKAGRALSHPAGPARLRRWGLLGGVSSSRPALLRCAVKRRAAGRVSNLGRPCTASGALGTLRRHANNNATQFVTVPGTACVSMLQSSKGGRLDASPKIMPAGRRRSDHSAQKGGPAECQLLGRLIRRSLEHGEWG